MSQQNKDKGCHCQTSLRTMSFKNEILVSLKCITFCRWKPFENLELQNTWVSFFVLEQLEKVTLVTSEHQVLDCTFRAVCTKAIVNHSRWSYIQLSFPLVE